MLTPLGAIPAALLLLLSLFKSQNRSQRTFIAICLCLAVLPLLIFTNLHIVHNYYQAANEVFLILAISAAFDSFIQVFAPRWQQMAAIVAITLFALGNHQEFNANYLSSTQGQSSDRLDIGQFIQRRTDPDSAIIVFADDWSSELAYHSRRHALTMPGWSIPGIDQTAILQQPNRFLGGKHLGAVISKIDIADHKDLNQSCPSKEIFVFNEWKVYLCKS
jgi:hypothetical protein